MFSRTSIGFTPVTQRVEGWPHGECVRATYAALLGLDIDDVPRFDPAILGGEPQHERECRWLKSLGLGLVEIGTSRESELPQAVLDCIPPVEHLISGISPRGFGHRCVGLGGRVLWDPHPSRAGLDTIYSVGFLVPL